MIPRDKFNIPRKPRKQAEPVVTTGPAAEYGADYNPMTCPRMRQAIERARRDQPGLITLDSAVPVDYAVRYDRRPLKESP